MKLIQFWPSNTLPIQWFDVRDRNTDKPLLTMIRSLSGEVVLKYCEQNHPLTYIFRNKNEHSLATYHLKYDMSYPNNSQNPVTQWRGGFSEDDQIIVGCYESPSQVYIQPNSYWSQDVVESIEITWFVMIYKVSFIL